jgi:hypothetical protein
MAIEVLVAFIPPPAQPIDGDGDWSIAEQELGITFPADFKQLIQRYGTGEFYGSLYICNPLKEWGRKQIQELLACDRELCDACEYDLKLHPARPGLLPWGRDPNGHRYCWWTEGEPDAWSIVQLFHGYEGDPMEIVPGPITSFLIRFMHNEYTNMLGGQPFDESDYHFKPGIPWAS